MKRKVGIALIIGIIPLIWSASAFAGDGVAVNITNDSTDTIVVTVYDMTSGPNVVVISHMRINGFTTIPVQVMPDSSGRALVSWTATSTDSLTRRCGHEDLVALDDSASLTVRADSSCSV
jgi:hypothetical protein